MSTLSYSSFFHLLRTAINEVRPFSFVRMGDGESIVIGYPEFTSEESCAKRYAKWFTLPAGNKAWMKDVSELIRNACKCADLVGLPGARHQTVSKDWRNAELYGVRYGLIGKYTCEMDFVIELQLRNDFRNLLRGREVRCITCRNVESVITNLGANHAGTFFLPPQVNPAFGKDYSTMRHYPEAFTEIRKWIASNPGCIYLVGAGGLGKIYCQWVREQGGIALDIGSTFDGWAGHPTRSYLRAMMPRYQVTPANPRVER